MTALHAPRRMAPSRSRPSFLAVVWRAAERQRLPYRSQMHVFRLATLTAASLSAAACVPAAPTPIRTPLTVASEGLPAFISSAEAGMTLFANQCATCHGTTGRGDGSAGAALRPPPPDLSSHAFTAGRSPYSYYSAISNGVPGTAMLRFDHAYDEATRWDLAFAVWQLGTSPAEIERGAALWASLSCADCHSGGLSAETSETQTRGTGGVQSKRRAEFDLARPERARLTRAAAYEALVSSHPELQDMAAADHRAVAEYVWTFLYAPVMPAGYGSNPMDPHN
jgi:mono/diheme cytochrome c family protein